MTTKHINLRLAPDLHSWLVGRATREHRSINGHIEHLLEQDRAADSMHAKEIRHRDGDPRNSDPSNLEVRATP
jgi:hypothetical protein